MLAEVAVAQVGVGVDLKDDQVVMATGEGAHGTGGERVFAAEHEGKGTACGDGFDNFLELVEGRRNAGCDLGRGQGGDGEVAIGFAPEFFIEEFELLAGRQNRGGAAGWCRCRS